MDSIDDYPPIKLLEYCVRESIQLEKWGFRSSVRFLAKYYPGSLSLQSDRREIPTIIYTSEKCRVMFQLTPSGELYSVGAHIYYGRLHASDNSPVIEWEDEDCYCWHSIEQLTIPFLNGSTSQEAVKNRGIYINEMREIARSNNSITQFSELTSDGRSQLQKLADDCKPFFMNTTTEYIRGPIKLHAAIWFRYGEKLFELFDLRNANLWSEYTNYLKEYYDIIGRDSGQVPEYDKVC